MRALLARGKVPYTAVTEIVTAILHAEFTTMDELLDSVVICKEFARYAYKEIAYVCVYRLWQVSGQRVEYYDQ